MDTTPSASTIPRFPLPLLITALSDINRWRILRELVKGEPLPVHELARRLAAKSANIARHCQVLFDYGIIQRGFGRLYKITPALLVPGQPAIDLGTVSIRLDLVE